MDAVEEKVVVSVEDQKILDKIRKEKVARFEKAKANAAKYPHALSETIEFDPVRNKYSVCIKCTECGDTSRRVYTSDLKSVHLCVVCAEKVKTARKVARREAEKRGKELYRQEQEKQKVS